jgi:hypothetical protein
VTTETGVNWLLINIIRYSLSHSLLGMRVPLGRKFDQVRIGYML